jgi:hypothetical protein
MNTNENIAEHRPDAAPDPEAGLEHPLAIRTHADWQQVVQLPVIREADIYITPSQQLAASLSVLDLGNCRVYMGGYDLGQLLLGCPQLKRAGVCISTPLVTLPADEDLTPTADEDLPCHPTLQAFSLGPGWSWGDGSEADAEFADLAPVISGVSDLTISSWPSSPSSSIAAEGLPDLSLCEQLTSLQFGCNSSDRRELPPPEQEDFMAMVEPLQQLQRLVIVDADRVNARAVPVLQHMLPELQQVKLLGCGRLQPLTAGLEQQEQQQEGEEGAGTEMEGPLQQEAAVFARVKQLLRPGLVLEVVSSGA